MRMTERLNAGAGQRLLRRRARPFLVAAALGFAVVLVLNALGVWWSLARPSSSRPTTVEFSGPKEGLRWYRWSIAARFARTEVRAHMQEHIALPPGSPAPAPVGGGPLWFARDPRPWSLAAEIYTAGVPEGALLAESGLGWPFRAVVLRNIFGPPPAGAGAGGVAVQLPELHSSTVIWWPGMIADLLSGPAFGVAALVAWRGARALRRDARLTEGRCPWCGYSASGLARTTPCPECGKTRERGA